MHTSPAARGSLGVKAPPGARVRAAAVAWGLVLVPALAACGDAEPIADEAAVPSAAPVAVPTYADGGATDAAGEGPAGGSTDADPATASAEVMVTFAQWDDAAAVVDISGYVSGTVESDGQCTLTLTRGSAVLTGRSPAYPDASTTSCSPVRVPVPAGQAGDWGAVLAYESPSTSVESAPFTVTIP